ncbi:MAG: FAD-dependent oxidoreductase [Acidobacteria bacterium]|nr:FAD-dependent oxidoreductase [Acidobacteriota bacterium]
MEHSPKIFDVIIIGGGPAGMAAAVWCADLGLTSIVLEKGKSLGGQLSKIHDPITNYVGINTKNGIELRDIFAGRLSETRTLISSPAEVVSIDPHGLTVQLADGAIVSGRAIFIATGVSRRRLGIAGETEFSGRGILESGAASREIVKGKDVVIVGGGDAAFENAVMLSEHARQVTLLHRSNTFSARSEFTSIVQNAPNVKIIGGVELSKITGGDAVEAIEYTDLRTRETSTMRADALLIRVGVMPNSNILPHEIDLDDRGYVITGRTCMTNIPFVFAVGDISNPSAPTINGAVGDAATAAKAAYRLLAASK